VKISIRLPSKATHPNARSHWRKKMVAVRLDRKCAEMIAREVMGSATFGWEAATVHAAWTFKTAARRDRDNLLSWCKAYFDGFADAGLIANDSGLTHLPHSVSKGKAEGVVFTFTRDEVRS